MSNKHANTTNQFIDADNRSAVYKVTYITCEGNPHTLTIRADDAYHAERKIKRIDPQATNIVAKFVALA